MNKCGGARGGRLPAARFRYHVTERVHLAKHFIEVLGGAPEFRRVTLAVEHVHAVLDCVELVGKWRNGLTQCGCVGSSWCRCKYNWNVERRGVFSKRRNV